MFKQITSKFVYIDEIDPLFQRYEIRVRIIRLWRGFKKDTGSAIEMVLVDEKGTRIHATVDDKLMTKYQSLLKEDGSVTIDTFQLINNSQDYRTSPITFKVNFYRTTLVVPYDDFPVDPPEKYFVEFSQILSGVVDHKILIDVIGRIASVGALDDIMIRGKPNTKLDIELQDTTGMRLTCTLWGKYADQVKTYADLNSNSTIICVLRLAQIKEFRGVWSISNAYSATKILLDPQIMVAEDFRTKIQTGDNEPIIVYDRTNTHVVPTVSLHDEFFLSNIRKDIHGIVTATENITCVTVATVDAIDDPYRWCYLCCKVCSKTVQPYPQKEGYVGPPSYDYEKCGKVVTNVVARYRLMLRVSHDLVETRFLLFDGMAEILLNKSAQTLLDEIPEDDPRVLPSVLLDLVGKKMLFKIRIGPDNKQNRNTHYVVQKFCDNPAMVEEFISGKTLTASYDSVIDSTFVPSVVGGARVDCAVDVSDGSSNSSELTDTKTVTGKTSSADCDVVMDRALVPSAESETFVQCEADVSDNLLISSVIVGAKKPRVSGGGSAQNKYITRKKPKTENVK
ncbi:unnamed protein product [Arabidopsis halleri]